MRGVHARYASHYWVAKRLPALDERRRVAFCRRDAGATAQPRRVDFAGFRPLDAFARLAAPAGLAPLPR